VAALVLSVTTTASQSTEEDDIPPHLGRIYRSTSPAAVWNAIERVMKRLKYSDERRKRDDGVYITKWGKQGKVRFQYHVFVPPTADPARVYIGSIATLNDSLRFNDPEGHTFLFAAIERELAITGETIPGDAQRRAMKALTLAAPSAEVSCLRRLASGDYGDTFTQPKEVTVSPRVALSIPGRPGRVRIEGQLLEDGYFRPRRLVEGDPILLLAGDPSNETLVSLAFGYSSLSRFTPGMNNGCGVPLTTTVEFTRFR
jgi:hypothetical protein